MVMLHGTNYGYNKAKCRCPLCRKWASEWQKRYRQRRMHKTGEVVSGSRGGFVPGKPCLCGCGENMPANSRNRYKRGHAPGKGKARQ